MFKKLFSTFIMLFMLYDTINNKTIECVYENVDVKYKN